MKKALLSAAAVLSLSSCHIYWNTGERLKESTVTYTGADTARPAGKVVYKAPDGSFYMQAPEVRYKAMHRLAGITPNGFGPGTDPDGVLFKHITPTGRFLWVKVDGTDPQLVDAPPAGCKAIPLASAPASARGKGLGCFSTERSGWYWPACTAAVPLDYVADPVLTVTTTAAAYIGEACMAPIGAIILLPQIGRQEKFPPGK